MKLMILGHGRHGKDTVAEILQKKYGMSFQSSSYAAASIVMMPYFANLGTPYENVDVCYADRHNHRKEWYEQILNFNHDNLHKLMSMIYEKHDIYVGIRSWREYMSGRNAGVFDYAIWVDRHEHCPPESKDSCTVEPWMADYVLDNNGTLEDLEKKLSELMATIQLRYQHERRWRETRRGPLMTYLAQAS